MSEKWIMHGMAENDVNCLNSVEKLANYIGQVGFLPLFRNAICGFSAEEHVPSDHWWTDDALDPWCWRMELARHENIAYGKFFDGKAGFISKEWFPFFASAARDGYDFDARADEGLAKPDEKRVMALFNDRKYCDTTYLRTKSELNKKFDITMTRLMQSSYLIISEFTQRINKNGEPYGWHIAIYETPENKWGYDHVTSAYRLTRQDAEDHIMQKISSKFEADSFKNIFGWR